MNLCKLIRLATVGAVALGFAAAGSPAWAVPDLAGQTWDAGSTYTVEVHADVENTFVVDITYVAFGNVGATAITGATGELEMAPDGTLTENNVGEARLVAELGTGQEGVLYIQGAFPDQRIDINYSNVDDLTCDSGVGGDCDGDPQPDLIIALITDDLAAQAGTSGVWDVDDADPDGDAIEGFANTDGVTGDLTISIGVTLRTDSTVDAHYASGTYDGSFDLTLEY